MGNCTHGGTGNLCGSCDENSYNLGPICAKCSDSMLPSVLLALAVAAAALKLFWRFSKTSGVVAAEMNCVLSCGSKKGGFEVAVELKQTMKERFGWASDSIYMDCDAMDDKPGTKRVPVTDAQGNEVIDPETGKVVMKSLNDDWHVFFREGVADAPAMLFSLTE